MRNRIICLCRALCLLFAVTLDAQAPSKRELSVNATMKEIRIDGVLQTGEWMDATRIELPYEVQPGENLPSRVKTECYVTYDHHQLYMGCRAHDPDPDQIRAHYSDRDRPTEGDYVGIVLDPFHDERRAFKFLVSPVGIQMDQFQDDVTNVNDVTWDAIWDSAGRIQSDGYVIEMAIPFRAIHFPDSKAAQKWGIDIVRNYPRGKKYVFSLSPRDRDLDCYLCQIQTISGFEGISTGNHVELDPTVTARRREQRTDFSGGNFQEEMTTDAGLSLIWGMTPNWTLNATANPDFSNVEADVAQLNVNRRFALYFPERRPFFLEGADLFETQLNAVFTRNIADPLGGIKLTGKSGRNAFGFLSSYDEITNLILPGAQRSRDVSLEEETLASVFRYRLDVGSSSSLGFLATDRRNQDYSSSLVGADGLLRLGASNSFRFQALGSQSRYPDDLILEFAQPEGFFKGYAYSLAFNHASRNWSFFAKHQNLHPDFRADMGFIPRVDTRFYNAGIGYNFVPDANDWYSFLSFSTAAAYRTDHEGDFLGRSASSTFQLGGPAQSILTIDGGVSEELFAGENFDQFFVITSFSLNPVKNIYLSVSTEFGNELDYVNVRKGDVLRIYPFVQMRLGRRVSIDLSHSYERLDVGGENLFIANLPQVRIIYQFHSRAFIRLISQYSNVVRNQEMYSIPVDPETTTLINQFLFSFKMNPRTVLFLGYSDNHLENGEIDFLRMNRTFFFKVGYAFQL